MNIYIIPVGHRVLVKPDEAELKTEWGFEIVSDKKLENAAEIKGTLIGVGTQAWKAYGPDFSGEPWAQLGDKVMYSQWSGKRVVDPVTKEEYLLMNDEDITAVILSEGDYTNG